MISYPVAAQVAEKVNTERATSYYLTAGQLADKLNLTVNYVYALAREKGDDTIPHVRIGRCVRYPWGMVVEWLEKKREDEGEDQP